MTKIPSPPEILSFLKTTSSAAEDHVTRKELATAFSLKGPERSELRRVLKSMEEKGEIALEGQRIRLKGGLPAVIVLDITGNDAEGDLVCTNITGEASPGTSFVVTAEKARTQKPPLGIGDRFLARITQISPDQYEASPIKRIGRGATRLLGVFHEGRRRGFVEPVSRKGGKSLDIYKDDRGDAKSGDLVWAEPLHKKGYGDRRGRIVSVIGRMEERRTWSLVALAENDIPMVFPENVVAEAEQASFPDNKYYQDLTHLPLITIDPKEAKDHDDAVYAEETEKGWRLIVAIADVSLFVRPGTALDREAEKRGNSVYLIDQVVPMLPEALSNGLCSLKAGEKRTAMCCEMQIGRDGRKISHKFFRAMILCKAGLAYEEAQAASDGHLTDRTRDLKEDVIDPLWSCWKAMLKARAETPSLDLDMPERQIVLRNDGEVAGVKVKERLEAHRLIETMMVAANVCAAETLEEVGQPLIYRVHEDPDPERLEGLQQYLQSMNYSLPDGQVLSPVAFNRILHKAKEREEIDLVSLAILRSQMQAVYAVKNQGHFGLNLSRYAHFTSPIRRYADLIVHRALVTGLKLGPGGARATDEERLEKIASHISDTERRAQSAERATADRYLAAYLQEEVGGTFPGRISGVTRAGIFVTLDETSADGFIPMRTLRSDYFVHDEEARALVGQDHGGRYHLGQRVQVRLEEVTPVQGGLRFSMLSEPLEGDAPKPSRRKSISKSRSPRAKTQNRPKLKHGTETSRKTPQKPARKKIAPPEKRQEQATPETSGLTVRRRPKKGKPPHNKT